MKKFFIISFVLIFFSLAIRAQEIISELQENPVIRAEYERMRADGTRETAEDPAPVLLPFFDDFSGDGIYPDSKKWIGEEAFLNTNYGYRMANIGAVTLDAIDSRGLLHANASHFPFQADSLTSRPIRLDSIFLPTPRKITVADSIYFSFYYQPQGRASQAPESTDSLILQFGYTTGDSVFANYYDSIWVQLSDYIHPEDTIYPGDTIFSPAGCADVFVIADNYYYYNDLIRMPCDSVFLPEFRWRRIWSASGMTLAEFYEKYNTYSKQVMIPITDSTRYFKNDFSFRFINYASLASENNPSWRGNCDQWNIDYVYLNINRSYRDTVYRQVSFVERPPSMLKRYEAMPYNQYTNNPGNEMKNELELVITNLDSTIFNSTYYYVVNRTEGDFQYIYPGGNCNLFPFNLNGYQNCIACAQHACPPVNFVFPLDVTDSAEFTVRHIIIGDITPTDTVSDTIYYAQKFFNYYAYDDGTPEAGYGLNLTPSGAMLAYRFSLNVKDTLRAIQMYFNRTQNDANVKFFDLMVWQDNNGKPGEVIYSQLDEKVEFSSELLGFHTYMLDEPILVNGTFYIGWHQQTPDNLNLGYDRYNNAQQQIFYNTSGEWLQSINTGALMMRPILGKPFDISSVPDERTVANRITVYPNPLNGTRISFKGDRILLEDYHGLSISVINSMGAEILRMPFSNPTDIGPLSPGLYLIAIKDANGRMVAVTRLIKN
ncbi:MAG: T9SS type A sorting domain-containing protein [Bacteroidales bacterium]|nr:T9SS type A sorting domain-containing protein [Bacteroidales bacterium]